MYEIHVTFSGMGTEYRKWAESIGWKFSEIDGDPVLGAGSRLYLTNSAVTEDEAKDKIIHLLVATPIDPYGDDATWWSWPFRAKIEKIVADYRTRP